MADNPRAPRPTVAPENSATPTAPAGNGAASEPRPAVSADLMAKASEMAATVAPQVQGGAAQGRAILLPNGMRRVDYIKARWAAGISRGQIVKELKAMGHETISYQVVFAATKDTKPATPAGASATAPAAPAASTETKPAE